ncbi:SLC13 family permease [Solirubrobacter soli]|uniref:SLC13 family permease n=1 Tax=Solirubrobacter soli TaxID=363832 RepID=UPI0004058A53|nr:ArsB/NhaD family transporter [Solirubrobacter soli]
MVLPVAVFAGSIALIASEKVDRTKVALLGAALVVVFGAMDQEVAIAAVEFEALGLLAGMMIVVRLLETTGVFSFVAIHAAQLSRGQPFALVMLLACATGVIGAFLDNLTTILLIVPVTFMLARTLDLDPRPIIVIEVIASNLGGTATLIGDPPNIMIGGHTGLSFNAFIANLAPVAWLCMLVVTAALYATQRKQLRVPKEVRRRVHDLDAGGELTDRGELRRLLPVFGLIIVAFFIHRPLHMEPATVALAGASLMLAVSRQRLDEVLRGIDWPTLFFFLGLFVMVGALEHGGAIHSLSQALIDLTGGDRTAELLGIAWISALVGGVVDNIPLTAAMIPVVEDISRSGDPAYWWALAIGACYGGNLTLVAAAANVAAAGMAARAGRPIGFIYFLRLGVPATLLSMTIATGYILLRYA